MGRTPAHPGWTTVTRTPAPILADLTSNKLAQRQKESTWL
jgi:hypothetical protein